MDLSNTATMVWVVSLGLGIVVTVVVAFLLHRIEGTADLIDRTASKIWDVGQRVASNTIHIPTLYRINDRVASIHATAGRIDAGASGIKAHAHGCPGCPQCLLDHGSK